MPMGVILRGYICCPLICNNYFIHSFIHLCWSFFFFFYKTAICLCEFFKSHFNFATQHGMQFLLKLWNMWKSLCEPAVHICDFRTVITSSSSFHGFIMNQFNNLLPVGLLVESVRALHRHRRGQGFESRTSMNFFFQAFFSQLQESCL